MNSTGINHFKKLNALIFAPEETKLTRIPNLTEDIPFE
jgi:hypothetical protein